MKKWLSLLLAFLVAVSILGCNAQPEATQPPETVQWHSPGDIEITLEQVEAIVGQTYEKPKNVILVIGDGMGPNDITMAEQYAQGVFPFGMVLNQIPHHGKCATYSANNPVTDSAAAATALATGVKTFNGYVGKDPSGNNLVNLCQMARQAGKKVGIVTDDALNGATPAAFAAHNISRENTEEIIAEMMDFGADVLIGKYDYVHKMRADQKGYITAPKVTEFAPVLDAQADRSKPFVGFNTGYNDKLNNELAHCAQVALNLLDNEKGFFLMIESSGTDKFGHSNNLEGKLPSTVKLDRTVAAVLLYMQTHPDTLLIVTSDHETGGLQLPDNPNVIGPHLFTVTTHTETQVRIFALGQGSEYFNGQVLDNTDVAKYIGQVLTQ